MYGGGNTFEGVKTDSLALEDPTKLAAFEARIERGEKIEPSDVNQMVLHFLPYKKVIV